MSDAKSSDVTLDQIARQAAQQWVEIWNKRQADRVYIIDAVQASITHMVRQHIGTRIDEHIDSHAKEIADELVARWIASGELLPPPSNEHAEMLERALWTVPEGLTLTAANMKKAAAYRIIANGGTVRDVQRTLKIDRAPALKLIESAEESAHAAREMYAAYFGKDE